MACRGPDSSWWCAELPGTGDGAFDLDQEPRRVPASKKVCERAVANEFVEVRDREPDGLEFVGNHQLCSFPGVPSRLRRTHPFFAPHGGPGPLDVIVTDHSDSLDTGRCSEKGGARWARRTGTSARRAASQPRSALRRRVRGCSARSPASSGPSPHRRQVRSATGPVGAQLRQKCPIPVGRSLAGSRRRWRGRPVGGVTCPLPAAAALVPGSSGSGGVGPVTPPRCLVAGPAHRSLPPWLCRRIRPRRPASRRFRPVV